MQDHLPVPLVLLNRASIAQNNRVALLEFLVQLVIHAREVAVIRLPVLLDSFRPLGKHLALCVLLVHFPFLLQEAVRHVRLLLVSIAPFLLQRPMESSVLPVTLALEVVLIK